jgi:hypothetical protein
MSLHWGESIFSNLYPLIIDLYKEESVKEKPEANVIVLNTLVGRQVEKKIQERFIPSFFNQDLCEKTSLLGRVSTGLFLICETLRLNRVFECLNQNSKLCSIVLKAERCWLAYLLDTYESIKCPPQNNKEVSEIAQHLRCVVVKNNNEELTNEEVQQRLNKLVALTAVFYEIHGKGHNDVTGKVPQTYFKDIFTHI